MARLSRLAGLLLGISVLLPAARTPAEEKAPAVRASADAALAQAQDYLRHAAVADLLERESAKIALERSRREDVRRFAQTMIEDHAKSAEMLRTAARRDGLPPLEVTLDAQSKAKLGALERTAPEDFDVFYLQMQVEAHASVLALHRHFASEGKNTALSAAAAAIEPAVQRHLDLAKRLAAGPRTGG